MKFFFKTLKMALFLLTAFANQAIAQELEVIEGLEVLSLEVISYEDFVQNNIQALNRLNRALHEQGIVGIKAVPGYAEKVNAFIEQARKFTALPEEVKKRYAPNHDKGEMFLGYEAGKERFKRPDGKWVVDDLKTSYYALVPDCAVNKWPIEVDLRTAVQDLGMLMSEMGESVMKKIGLVGPSTTINLDGLPTVSRMLCYRKNLENPPENPFWCGAHFDHGLFTALLPAFYFLNGVAIPEPAEAGLFIRTSLDGPFKKVISDDPEVLLFQVGEFGQLVSNDAIKATEHRVHKAKECVERYTMALFFDAPMDTVIHSSSVLTCDERYGGILGAPCSYRQWHERSFHRYLVKEE